MRRVVTYSMLGALVGLGAPLGLLVVHAILRAHGPLGAWLGGELRAAAVDYGYLTVSTSIALAILAGRWAHREEELRASALTDPLTGLWNRRQLAARLREELARAQRYRHPLSLLFIDVDRLKQINDLHGHDVGDRALVAVAEAVRASCRNTDVAARYGGDELAVLAPHTTGEAGLVLAERIRAAVKRCGLAGVSVSIGVADLDDAPANEEMALYQAADRALYRAKAQGRDRVARGDPPLYGAPPEPAPRPEHRLQIVVRRVFSGDGKLGEAMQVYCRDRRHLVTVQECTGCTQWSGLHLDPTERASFLNCTMRDELGGPACEIAPDRLAAIMSPSVFCLAPELHTNRALEFLVERHIGGAPVVDPAGKLLGVVTRTDLAAAEARRGSPTVAEVMTPMVFALQADAPIAQAAALMVVEGVHRLVVVSPRGELLGILSPLDVMKWLAERDGYLRPRATAAT